MAESLTREQLVEAILAREAVVGWPERPHCHWCEEPVDTMHEHAADCLYMALYRERQAEKREEPWGHDY